MKKIALLVALTSLLAAGCNQNQDGALAGNSTPPSSSADSGAVESPQGSERTWVGLLPCSDCQGIDTRLVLRSQGGRRDYLMTETYLGSPGKNSFSRAGSWNELSKLVDGEPVTFYVLDPDQAGQRLSLQPDGALELLEGNENRPAQAIAYRLQRL